MKPEDQAVERPVGGDRVVEQVAASPRASTPFAEEGRLEVASPLRRRRRPARRSRQYVVGRDARRRTAAASVRCDVEIPYMVTGTLSLSTPITVSRTRLPGLRVAHGDRHRLEARRPRGRSR